MARILIIDDMAPIRESINIILSDQGHEIDEAEDGKKGLKKLHNGDYDLVITDILMPEKDGTEILMKIRSEGLSTPVIAMSGGGNLISEDYALEMAKNYANAVLKKPFSRDKLRSIVDDLLQTENGGELKNKEGSL